MQRFFIPFGTVGSESTQKLQEAYNSLLEHENKLAKLPNLTQKKFIELIELKQLISEINIVSYNAEDDRSKAEKLQAVLTKRWPRIIKISERTYPYAVDTPQTVFCLALARMLHEYSPNQFPSVYQLLMPTLKNVTEFVSKKKLDDLPLGSFMLSEDGASPIPLSILERHCNQLMSSAHDETAGFAFINHYKESDQSKLTEAECNRLIAFSEEGRALYDAAKKYAEITKKPDYFQVGRQLQLLRQGLERARVASNGGDLGIDGDYAVIEFSEYFNALSESAQNTILSDRSIKYIWDKLSKPGEKGANLCIQGMDVIRTLDLLFANKDFLYDKATELEKAYEQYQRTLKRFQRAAADGDFIVNEAKTDNNDNFIAMLRTLATNKELAEQCLSISNVVAFIRYNTFEPQLIDMLAARYETNWLNFFKLVGVSTERLALFFIEWIKKQSIAKLSQSISKDLIFDLQISGNAVAQLYEIAIKNNDNHLFDLLIQSNPAYFGSNLISKSLIAQLYDVAAKNQNERLFKLLLQYQPYQVDGADLILRWYVGGDVGKEIAFLKKMGVKADGKDKNGDTLLTHIAKKQYSNVLFKNVIECYPELINVPNVVGDTALSLAASNNDRDKVEMLLKIPACDINLPNAKGQTPLDLACENKHSKIARWLLEKNALGDMDKIAKQFLHEFIKEGGSKDNVIKTLIARHVDLSQCDAEGNSPLFNAAVYGSDDVLKQILEVYPEGVYYKNQKQKLTPLDIAVWNGSARKMPDKIKLLLTYYPREYFARGEGEKAIGFAVEQNLPGVVILLLEAGVPLTTPVPGYLSIEKWALKQDPLVQEKIVKLSEKKYEGELQAAKVRIVELEAKVRLLESTITASGAALSQQGMFAPNQATSSAQRVEDQKVAISAQYSG